MTVFVLVSIPVLLMMRAVQAYRYSAALETVENHRIMQEERLEENKRALAGIAVYSAPERVYEVGDERLDLEPSDPGNVLQVQFPEDLQDGK